MALTQEQISRLSKLCALREDSHVELDSVLSSIETISVTDINSVQDISRSGMNILQPATDIVFENESFPDALLACSPQKVAAHQIVLAGIMHGE